jgi:hypothetical protein
LRRIDPSDPNLTYFANPGVAPSQQALDRLNEVIKTSAIRRILGRVILGGAAIGKIGDSVRVREHPRGVAAARELLDYLRVGGAVYR